MTSEHNFADMAVRHLGGLKTSALGFGCMGLSQGYGPVDDAESIAAIHAALDSGITMLDTAMSYGQGHNEELVLGWMPTPTALPPTATIPCAD